jgi:hypothetical protein
MIRAYSFSANEYKNHSPMAAVTTGTGIIATSLEAAETVSTAQSRNYVSD